MDKKVILLGAGGHAKVLLDILLTEGARVAGILAKDGIGGFLYDVPILGDDDMIGEFSPDEAVLVNGLGSVGDTGTRRRLYEKFKGLGYNFRQIIHNRAVVSARSSVGTGAQIMGGAVINIGASVGENSIINTGAVIDHDTQIGDHVHIAPGCVISGGVVVGNGSHIGTGATIIQGITIGENALIAAGSVVIRDVPANETVYGVPAKPHQN